MCASLPTSDRVIFTIKTAWLRKHCWKTEPLISMFANAKWSQFDLGMGMNSFWRWARNLKKFSPLWCISICSCSKLSGKLPSMIHETELEQSTKPWKPFLPKNAEFRYRATILLTKASIILTTYLKMSKHGHKSYCQVMLYSD